ncbi:MAG: hypothetical protein ABIR70_10620 [Bryobacteraceae bacterium]
MTLNPWLPVIFALSTLLHAQDRQPPPAPKTKIEAFEAQSGSVVVRGFSRIGEMKGIYGGVLTVQSMEFTQAVTGKKEYGITIDVKETDRLERSNRSFIDYDEIASLLKGIEYVSKIDSSVTPLESFQADFRTKGDFKVSTFSSGKEILASISSGSIGATSLFLRLSDVPKLRDLVASARDKLDAVKAR